MKTMHLHLPGRFILVLVVSTLLLLSRIDIVTSKRSNILSSTTKSKSTSRSTSTSHRHVSKSKRSKIQKAKEKKNHALKNHHPAPADEEDITNIGKKTVGTRITGAGHHNKRNRSIFKQKTNEMGRPLSAIMGNNGMGDVKESILGKRELNNKGRNPIKGRMYAKFTNDGRLLFRFPEKNGQIVSLSSQLDVHRDGRVDPVIHSNYLDAGDEEVGKMMHPSDSKEWIPIEGIFGIYMLPSGPHLVLITDSEETYKINGSGFSPIANATIDKPLISLRRVLSMEIVRIPSTEPKRKGNSEERRQFSVLRRSLKEHEFYYVPPVANEDQDSVVQDVTHTLQRSFVHWAAMQERQKEIEAEVQLENIDEIEVEVPIAKELLNDANIDLPEPNSIFNASVLTHSNITNASVLDLVVEDPVDLVSEDKPSSLWSWFTTLSSRAVWDYGEQDIKAQNSMNDTNVRIIESIMEPGHASEQVFNGASKDTNINIIESITDTKHDGEQVFRSWWSSMIKQKGSSSDCGQNHFQIPDSRFFWNEECVTPFLRAFEKEDNELSVSPCQMLLDHTLPVTSAFVGIQRDIALVPNATAGTAFSVRYDQLLISRRSKYRAGTRFTKRGADAVGDVANFAETEQICIVRNDTVSDKRARVQEIYSHVQTRGSIPIRWSSPTDIKTYKPKVMIGTNPLAQARALRNHLVEQLSLYSTFADSRNSENANLAFINLIDKHSDQGRLGRTFGAVLDAVLSTYQDEEGAEEDVTVGLLNPDSVSNIWFDFHAECSKGRYDRLKYLLDDVRPCLDSHGYFCAIPGTTSFWEIVRLQNGVVRTNCMDCLDRTNVVQSMFGRYILYQQFNDRYGLKASTKRKLPLGYNTAFKRKMITLPWNAGEVSHRLLWADNADEISRLYAGTPALKGDFTRTGKRTKRGALDDGVNSLTRFYLNNFLDGDRQEGMDLLTGFVEFDTTESPEEIKSDHKHSRGSKATNLSKKRIKELFEQERLNSVAADPRLSLNWVAGDLQSHFRSAALSRAFKDDGLLVTSSDVSLSVALRDIDRRAMLDDPWWATESDDETSNRATTKKRVISSSSSYVMGALIASIKAPITTAIALICFMIPGMHAEE